MFLDDDRLSVPFDFNPSKARPEKRNSVPQHQIKQVVRRQKTAHKTLNPVYQPRKPAIVARQYYSRPQYFLAPHREKMLNQQSVLLPHRVNYLFSPQKSIASFARRNPFYTSEPKMLTAPRRNVVVMSRANPIYQKRFMYKPNLFYSWYQQNPRMNAQRRAFGNGYRQQQHFPFLARRPLAYGPSMVRSIAHPPYYREPVGFNYFRAYGQRPYVYARDQTLNSNHLNLNMGTGSHTQSHSILKAPGHTTTDTHVINKQQTGGRVRGVAPAPKGKQPYRVPIARYPFLREGYRTRGQVSASAKVNAKAAASQSSSSQSASSSASKTNGGSRTTSTGGWGGGAGAGWGSGQNAWGIGYGGGGGGSNWKIPNNMVGIPGMPGKFPGIPQGFPGMPPGGYPSKGKYVGNAKHPPSTPKGKKVSLKLQKGLKDKAFKKPQNIGRPKTTAQKNAKKLRPFSSRPRQMAPVNAGGRGQIYRVQFFTSDPRTRPASREWQKLRQSIISDVMNG